MPHFSIVPIAARAGSPLRTILPEDQAARFDPFLVLHEQGPVRYAPFEAIGFPEHPHRGFETVTYVIEGEQFHRDSEGHHGVIGPGDVQWMTAASGILHSETPLDARTRRGDARLSNLDQPTARP